MPSAPLRCTSCEDWISRPHWQLEHTPAPESVKILRSAMLPPSGELGDYTGIPVRTSPLVPPGELYVLGDAASPNGHRTIVLGEPARPLSRWQRIHRRLSRACCDERPAHD